MLYLYLAAGGVIGTLARYGLGQWIPGWAGTGFPWHTLFINLAGSLVLGFAMRAFQTLPVTQDDQNVTYVGSMAAGTAGAVLVDYLVRQPRH